MLRIDDCGFFVTVKDDVIVEYLMTYDAAAPT
jgi:hypothetical protein